MLLPRKGPGTEVSCMTLGGRDDDEDEGGAGFCGIGAPGGMFIG